MIIGLADGLEFFFGAAITVIEVGMVLFGKFLVARLDIVE
jgi:hypothetical protein